MISRNLGFRFSLVSYNILSQTLLSEHNYLYSGCNPADLEWPRRGHKIVSELLDDRADIICLQEVESEHMRQLFGPKLSMKGYGCLYKKKTGFKLDGCAIFYRRSRFQLLKHKAIEFNRGDVDFLLNRDNVGLIAVLEPKSQPLSNSAKLVIANTHLLFNPRRNDVKLAQLKYFLSELEVFSRESHDDHSDQNHCPTILCGDLNSSPGSEVSKYILKNQQLHIFDDGANSSQKIQQDFIIMSEDKLNTKVQNDGIESHIENYSHSLEFRSVHPTQNKQGQPYVSTFSGCIVDYIFYTPRLTVETYRELLTADELREIGPLPNPNYPSDHLALEAKFILKL